MKKLVIGLAVVALALAVVLGVQVGQGNKLRAEIEDQRAKVAALEPVSAEAEELKKQVTALTEEKEKALQEAEAAAKALTDERDALAAEAEAAGHDGHVVAQEPGEGACRVRVHFLHSNPPLRLSRRIAT